MSVRPPGIAGLPIALRSAGAAMKVAFFLDIANFVPYMSPINARSTPDPPVIPNGRKPLTVIPTERSERRNPAGDGGRPDAGTCGVDGARAGLLHYAPAGGRASGRNDGRGRPAGAPATRRTH